jgi:hypothetical protein
MVASARELKVRGEAMVSIRFKPRATEMTVQGKEWTGHKVSRRADSPVIKV